MSGRKHKAKRVAVTKKPAPPVPRHCDDYIDDPTQPSVLRTWLDRARSPGHGMMSEEPYPKLFADYEGKRVRVTMASRFGDVGISHDLDDKDGYFTRVAVEFLSNFSDAIVTEDLDARSPRAKRTEHHPLCESPLDDSHTTCKLKQGSP